MASRKKTSTGTSKGGQSRTRKASRARTVRTKPKAASRSVGSRSVGRPKGSIKKYGRNNDDTNSTVARRAGQNLMEAVGGKEQLVHLLTDSHHPKAAALIDRLNDTKYAGESFPTSYTSVGLKAVDIVQMLGEVQQARTFIRALMQGDEVMQSLIRKAKDKLEPHDKCDSTGKKLDRKTGDETTEDCGGCHGTGYILVDGDLQSQQLYFELISWKKQGGMINIFQDARRQSVHFDMPQAMALPGHAPNVQQIIQRADNLMLNPQQQITSGTTTDTDSTDSSKSDDPVADEILEAEEVTD